MAHLDSCFDLCLPWADQTYVSGCVCIQNGREGKREIKPFSLCVGVVCGFKVLCFHLLTATQTPLKCTVNLLLVHLFILKSLYVNMMRELTIMFAKWRVNPRSQICLTCQRQTTKHAFLNANLQIRSGIFNPGWSVMECEIQKNLLIMMCSPEY